MRPHALRILQSAKFNLDKAASMIDTAAKERVTRLPLTEAEVLPALRQGFVYWHGRDRCCRPCLVIRLSRLGELVKDKERAIRAVIFALEYIVRFGMVPGRVENWVALLDMADIFSLLSPLQLSSFVGTAAALGRTLEQLY